MIEVWIKIFGIDWKIKVFTTFFLQFDTFFASSIHIEIKERLIEDRKSLNMCVIVWVTEKKKGLWIGKLFIERKYIAP